MAQALRYNPIMSASPVTIAPSASVQEAQALLQQRKIRHLPVLQKGRLVGMISDRDVRLVLPSPTMSLTVWEIRHLLDQLTVGEVITYAKEGIEHTTENCMVLLPAGFMLDSCANLYTILLPLLVPLDGTCGYIQRLTYLRRRC
jgi:CBS-domain-containing membrane protein